MSEIVLGNARIVLADAIIEGALVLRGEKIALVDTGRARMAGALDMDGDYLIPGVVDVHTDNLERQVQPRQNARWPSRSAMMAHDAQCAAAGVTSVLDALCLGDLGFNENRVRTFHEAVADLKQDIADSRPKLATRQSSQKVLEALVPATPDLVGGSADLTGSNLTLVKGMGFVTPGNYAGRYIHYGIREFGMAACANGMALHGGIIPYTGTFFVFTDYMRPAIRLGALMRQRVIHVLTHDSIGLGEDGPTHQPVEHLASLRAMPGVHVFRPADAMETAECWELAIRQADGPSLLVLTRQALPALRSDVAENRSARGGYVLAEADGARQATAGSASSGDTRMRRTSHRDLAGLRSPGPAGRRTACRRRRARNRTRRRS